MFQLFKPQISSYRTHTWFAPLCWLTLASGIFLLVFTELLPYGHALDKLISDQIYDPLAKRFILNVPDGSFKFWLYSGLKNVLLCIPIYALVQIVVGAYLRFKGALNKAQRQAWLRWCMIFTSILLATSLISLLKKLTNQACPWHITDYGGLWPYVDLFTQRPWPARSMQCWPGGHASGGFALMIIAMVGGWPAAVWTTTQMKQSSWRSARFWLWASLALGTIMGFTQLGMGAHYFSHQWWTLWWVLAFNLLFVWCCRHVLWFNNYWFNQ